MVTQVIASIYGPMLVVWLRTELLRNYDCPCNTGCSIQASPPFVGNDFYCESASNSRSLSDKLYNTDPLWNGQECNGLEGPCCTHPNMPWFKKTLNQVTSENIELRLCFNRAVLDGTPLQIVELYVRWHQKCLIKSQFVTNSNYM